MSWLRFSLAVCASGLITGCQLLVPFETVPSDGSGGGGGGGGTGGVPDCVAGCCVTDCPVPADPCLRAVCLAGTCSEEPVPDGADAGAQTQGDCKKNVCQDGAVTPISDNDPLDDGNACTTDDCDNGSPVTSPAPAAFPCTGGAGSVCDGMGHCVQCLQDSHCSAPTPLCDTAAKKCVAATCGNGAKDAGETDIDCGGACGPCSVGDNCASDADCVSNICTNGKCAAPSCDDGQKNGAETDIDCGGDCPNECGPGQGCESDSDCTGNECSGQGGTCIANCSDGVENNNESDVDCGPGCPLCPVGADCEGVDASCESGNCGAMGTCEMGGGIGSPCANSSDCASGACADGVCCSSPCNGLCEACDFPGALGICSPMPPYSDPDNECEGGAFCSGGNNCIKVGGQACAGAGECSSGFCVDGVCCADACTQVCRSCALAGGEGTCSSYPAGTDPEDECSGSMFCDGADGCTF